MHVNFSFEFSITTCLKRPILIFSGRNKLLRAVREPCTASEEFGGTVAEVWAGAAFADGDRLLWGRLCDGDKLRAAKAVLNAPLPRRCRPCEVVVDSW
jgi:hypothetical protein